MTLNIPLIREVMTYVFEHPKEWVQSAWGQRGTACGTTFCIAGHTASIAEARSDSSRDVRVLWDALSYDGSFMGAKAVFVTTPGVGSSEREIEHFAREELGLSYFQAAQLFYSSQDEAWGLIERYTLGEVTKAKIAAEVKARHRTEDERTTDEESDGRDNEEPILEVVVHEVPVREPAFAGTRVTA